MQPMRGGMGEAQEQGAACRRGEPVLRRLAEHFGAIAIGEDEPCVERQDVSWKRVRDSEGKAIAMGTIGRPFVIGAKVGDGGFHLDDVDRAVVGERDDIRPPAREQRKLGQCREPEPAQHSPRPARDKERGVGLAPVLEGFDLERCGVNESRHFFLDERRRLRGS